jgi:superfamily II DNA or RNA helicase
MLREYQYKILKECSELFRSGVRSVLLCAPTGAGKTKMFTYVAKSHKGAVITLTHRMELKMQVEVGEAVMVETLNNILKNNPTYLHQYSFIIIDECHLNSFNKIFDYIHKDTKVLGVTATPFRKPKEGQLKDFYEALVQGIDTPQLIEDGFLCPAKSYGVDIDLKGIKKKGDEYDLRAYYQTNRTYEGVVDNWERICKGTKTLLFSSNIASSKEVAEEFVKKGYLAKHIDGTTPLKEREVVLNWFDKTPNAIVCNCGVLTTGFNQPDIETIILYRATTSVPLFLQMCGRGSRVAENKTHFNILDFGNNIHRLGFWENPRVWSLDNTKKRKKGEGLTPTKTCKKCGAINHTRADACIICSEKFVKTKAQELAELKLLTNARIDKMVSEATISELIFLERTKKLKVSFVWRVLRTRGAKALSEYQQIKNYKEFWVTSQLREVKQGNTGFHDKRV